jgi:hypothetical protein
MQYAVYKIELLATKRCKRTDPYQWYIGSTYIDDEHGVEDRVNDHRQGRNSNIIQRGYVVLDGFQVSVHPTRPSAEEAERETAIEMRKNGSRVWQA